MTQLLGQWFRRLLMLSELFDSADGSESLVSQVVVEEDVDSSLRSDVVEHAAIDRLSELFFEQKGVSTELDGVVFPVRRCVVAARARALVFDRVEAAVSILYQVQLAGNAESLGTERDAAGVQGWTFLAGAVGEVWVVDASMLKEAVLDVFVDRHHGVDVLKVVEPWAVADLVQGSDGDEVFGDDHENASIYSAVCCVVPWPFPLD